MARTASYKRRGNKKARSMSFRRRMAPHTGRIGAPVDVRSPKDIPRALDLLKKGPVTLVFIYADWCGHCQRFKPKYNNAVRTPGRNMQAIQVSDTMVSDFNSALENEITGATPLTPEGYPEILLVNAKGKPVGNVPPSASESDLIVTMTNADKIATPSTGVRTNATGEPSPMVAATNTLSVRNSNRPANSIPEEPTYVPEDMTGPTFAGTGSLPPSSPTATRTPNTLRTPPRPIDPSRMEEDIIPEFQPTPRGTTVGGGLYSALASAAYSLAPAGILLAGLHAVRGRKRTLKYGKRSKRVTRNKRTRRNIRR